MSKDGNVDANERPVALIIEPHFEQTTGHSIRYVKVLVEVLAAGGAEVEVFASRHLSRGVRIGARVRRVFDRPIYREWNQPAGLRVRIYHRVDKIVALFHHCRRLANNIVGTFEPPPAWSPVSRLVRPKLSRALHWARRLIKVLIASIAAIFLFPLFLIVAVITALIGRRSTFSSLSPFTKHVLKAVEQAQSRGPTRIVVPTATLGVLNELLAIPVMHNGPLPPLHLLFHDGINVWANWYRPTTPEGVAARLRASGWVSQVYFYATTEAVAEQLRNKLGDGIYVKAVDDVFSSADLDAIKPPSVRTKDSVSLPSHERALASWISARRAAGLQIALIPGPLRLDKGAKNLPDLVAALNMPEGKKFALVIQRSHQYEWLASYFRTASVHPNVYVIESPLSDHAMFETLSEADVVLLPYQKSDYATRISSVVTEAVLNARPTMMTEGIASQAEFRNSACCRFIQDWRDWPKVASSLIKEADADRGALARSALELDRRLRDRPSWRTIVQNVLAPTPLLRAKQPMILVRPWWPKSGSARLLDEQLAFFASENRPVLELMMEPWLLASARRWFWRSVLEDRASSPAGVVCCSTPQSGIISRLLFCLRRSGAILRSTYTGQLAELTRLCPIPNTALTLARKQRAAFALVHHYFRLPFVESLRRHMPIWLETQDVQAALHVQHGNTNMLSGKYDNYPDMLADEMRWTEKADAVVAINKDEEFIFKAHVTPEKVFLCQPPISVAPAPAGVEIVPRRHILIIASDNPGNLASVKWFLNEVWPAVRAAGLDATIIGNINYLLEVEGVNPQGVWIRGAVDHLAPWYRSARVVALPMIKGTGLSIKTIEAMSANVPIVATSLAYRGLPVEWKKPAPPIDDPAEFAAELIRICRNGSARAELLERVCLAYQELDLENRYRHQMQLIEAQVIKNGALRLSRMEQAS